MVELARDMPESDAWVLLAQEGMRLLRKLGLPATAFMFVVSLRQDDRVPASFVDDAFELVCQSAFEAPHNGSALTEEQLTRTHRAASALLHTTGDFLPNSLASECALPVCAALDVLARIGTTHVPSRASAAEQLAEQLASEYPAMAAEINFVIGRENNKAPISTQTTAQTRGWQEEIARLGNELDQAIGVHRTRGLALLNRIQVDNNRRVFRPLLDALLSEDRLPSQSIHEIRQLHAGDLLDRHPLQTGTAGPRKISGSARADTIRDYEDIVNKLRRAMELRLKIEGRDRRGEKDRADLDVDLRRYIAAQKGRLVDAREWLLVRLLRGETLVCARFVSLPDPSMLCREHAHTLRLAVLFALAEPNTFARAPSRVMDLHHPRSALGALVSELGRQDGAEVRWECLAQALTGELLYLEARVWSSLSRAGVDAMPDLSSSIESGLINQRRAILNELGSMESSWPTVAGSDERQVFLRHVDAARRLAEPGYLRLAAEQQAKAALLYTDAVGRADALEQQARAKLSARIFDLRQQIDAAGGKCSIVVRALDAAEEKVEKSPLAQAEASRLIDLSERVVVGDISAELTLRGLLPAELEAPDVTRSSLDDAKLDVPVQQPASPALTERAPQLPIAPVQAEIHDHPSSPQDLDTLFSRAEQIRARGQLVQAERLFRSVLAKDRGHRRARSQLVTLLEQQRRREEAILLLEEGLHLFPSHLPFLNQLAGLCGMMDRLHDAKLYAEKGLSLCSSPDQEIGFLNQLWKVEQRLGNTAKAIEHLRRLSRQQPHVAAHENTIARLRPSLTQEGVRPPVKQPPQAAASSVEPQLDVDPEWGLLPERLEISDFLEEDLRREYTKVSPDFLEVKGPERVIDAAVRLAHDPISNPNTVRPGDDAEKLRTAAKLLRELHDRRPDFDFASYVRHKYHGDAFGHVHHEVEETLRRYLSYYASRMGDYHLLHGRNDAARAYYLEYFRVFGELRMSSAMAVERYIRTWIDEAVGFRDKARSLLQRRSNRIDRNRLATEMVLILFSLAIDEFLPDGLQPPHASNAWSNFLWGFLDVCRVNEAARNALLRQVERDEHSIRGAVERLVNLGALGIKDCSPIDWVRAALQARREIHRKVSNDLEYLRERLLPAHSYGQGIELVAELRSVVQSEFEQQLLGQTQEILRNADRYFHAPRFHEKSYFASELQLRISNLQQDIAREPTEIGRLHVAKIIFRVSRDVQLSHDEYKQRSLPKLHIEILKGVPGERVFRCDIQVENQGLSPAEDIRLGFWPSDQSEQQVGQLQLPILLPGSAHAAHDKVDLTLSNVSVGDATDIIATGSYRDADGNEHAIERAYLRVGVSSHRMFRPISNPYRTGPVVKTKELFKGRDDLIREILAEIAGEVAPGAAVLYGQKRSGKSSILFWLAQQAPEWIVPVEVDLHASFDREASLPSLLDLIVGEIVYQSKVKRGVELRRLDESALFESRLPKVVFRRYLEEVNVALGPARRLLILFDEFTDLIERIESGSLDRSFLRFLKSIIEDGLFSCVICGVDSMPKALKRYSNDFAIANLHLVSYLDPKSALELIHHPLRLDDDTSRFHPSAANAIFELTAGAPYYIQVVCSKLVDYLNREKNPDPMITRADVEHTILEIVRNKVGFNPWLAFDSLCRYKEDGEKDTRASVLEGLLLFMIADEMKSSEYVSHAKLKQRLAGIAREDEVETTLNELVDREVLIMPSGSQVRQWRIKVTFYYRWIIENRAMDDDTLGTFRRKLERLPS